MKRYLTVFLAGVFLIGCGGGGSSGSSGATGVSTVSVTPGSATDFWGYTAQLRAVALDGSGAMIAAAAPLWSSSDTNVATVDATGLVTYVNPGSASITASIDGVVSNRSAITVRGLSAKLATSGEDNCAVDDLGTSIYCWGDGYPITNNRQDLALQSDYPSAIYLLPGQIPVGSAIAQVTPGFRASCAVTEPGKAYCWAGAFTINEAGKLGTGGTLPIGLPAAVLQGEMPVASTVKKVAIVDSGAQCALVSDGRVYCWGEKAASRPLQTPTGAAFLAAPARLALGSIPASESITDVEVTINETCVVIGSGRLYCTDGGSFAPLPIGAIPTNVKITRLSSDRAGDFYTGLGDDGWVYAWGGGFGRRYGAGDATFVADGKIVKRLSQGAIPLTVKLIDVSAGGIAAASCAIGNDGRAYCWGAGYFGSLGDGNLAAHDSLVPVQVLQGEVPTGVKLLGIHCGKFHCSAIASDRKVYAWGYNEGAAIGQSGATAGSSAVPRLITRVSSS